MVPEHRVQDRLAARCLRSNRDHFRISRGVVSHAQSSSSDSGKYSPKKDGWDGCQCVLLLILDPIELFVHTKERAAEADAAGTAAAIRELSENTPLCLGIRRGCNGELEWERAIYLFFCLLFCLRTPPTVPKTLKPGIRSHYYYQPPTTNPDRQRTNLNL